MRIIARSPTPFRLKNPALKEALEALGIEWLTPDQVKRICECPAPSRKKARRRIDREFGYYTTGVDPLSPKRSARCNRFFWAWRRDQTTCDIHRWAASMLRVEKHRKGKSKHLQKARQLKDARLQSKRVRRANKKALRLAQKSQPRPITPTQLQLRNDMADFRLLQSIKLGLDYTDPERLEIMIEDGYVQEGSGEYQLSGKGLRRMGELRRRLATH